MAPEPWPPPVAGMRRGAVRDRPARHHARESGVQPDRLHALASVAIRLLSCAPSARRCIARAGRGQTGPCTDDTLAVHGPAARYRSHSQYALIWYLNREPSAHGPCPFPGSIRGDGVQVALENCGLARALQEDVRTAIFSASIKSGADALANLSSRARTGRIHGNQR